MFGCNLKYAKYFVALFLIIGFFAVNFSFVSYANDYEEDDTLEIEYEASCHYYDDETNELVIRDLPCREYIDNKEIDSLRFDYLQFDDLTELEIGDNIIYLSFTDCTIGSLKGIEKMQSVENLYFVGVGIENVNGIEKLENLADLTLYATNVRDLSPLADVNMRCLDISNSMRIENLDVVYEWDNLEYLHAVNCEMSLDEPMMDYLMEKQIATNYTYESLEIKSQVESLAESLHLSNMRDTQRIKTITEYVIDNIKYDYDVVEQLNQGNDEPILEYNDNALKYALQGTGCCRNYTALTEALLLQAGIDAYEVSNSVHIWNMVQLDGEFYNIDTTFIYVIDDKEIAWRENYMAQDENFYSDHLGNVFPSSFYNLKNKVNLDEVPFYNNDTMENTETENNRQTNNKDDIILVACGILSVLSLCSPLFLKIKSKEV